MKNKIKVVEVKKHFKLPLHSDSNLELELLELQIQITREGRGRSLLCLQSQSLGTYLSTMGSIGIFFLAAAAATLLISTVQSGLTERKIYGSES